MKRILSTLLILSILLPCIGCSSSPNESEVSDTSSAADTHTEAPPAQQEQPPQKEAKDIPPEPLPPVANDVPAEPEEIPEEPYVRTIDPSRPMVALTFDDGPHKTNSHALLDILEENHSVATFFEVGRNVSQAPDALVRMLEMGCEVGSHSKAHDDLSLLNQSGILADLDAADTAFINAMGQAPTLVRPPYGATNKAVREGAGRSIIMWTVDTLDWKLRDAQKVTEYIQNYGNLDGEIVLLHSIHDSTIESMRTVIPWLIEQGYQLVTVTELLAYYYGEYPELNQYYGYDYLNAKKKTDTPLEIPEGGYVPTPVEIPVINVTPPAPSQPVVTPPPADTPQDTPSTDLPPVEEPPAETPPAEELPTDTPPSEEIPVEPAPDNSEVTDPSQPPAWLLPTQPESPEPTAPPQSTEVPVTP